MERKKLSNGLNTFQKKVLNIHHNDITIYDFVIRNDLKYAWIIALIVIFANSFWLIANEIFSYFDRLKEPIVFISLLVQILFSVGLFIISLKNDKIKNILLIRHIFLFYYLYMIFTVTVLIVSENISAFNNNIPSRYVGLSLVTCYLFIVVSLPMPKIRDGIIICLALLISLIVPLFLEGNESYSFAVHLVLRICLGIGYFAFRKYNINLAKKSEEIVELNHQLLVSSYVDFLTDVMNRRALDTYWEYLCQKEEVENVGIILFDVDFFKSYNDAYSHRKGDLILKKIGEIGKRIVDNEEKFIFRYGGEEFIVVLVNTTKKEILDFANEIRREIYNENISRQDVYDFDRITVTCGCGIIDKENMNASDYITDSDKQLYVGKRNNSNCIVFDVEIF